MTLEELRRQIDAVDEQLLELLNRRARLVAQAAQLKQRRGARCYAPGRERALIQRLERLNAGPFPTSALGAVWGEVLSATRGGTRPVRVAVDAPHLEELRASVHERLGRSTALLGCLQPGALGALAQGRAELALVPLWQGDRLDEQTLWQLADGAGAIEAILELPGARRFALVGAGEAGPWAEAPGERVVVALCQGWRGEWQGTEVGHGAWAWAEALRGRAELVRLATVGQTVSRAVLLELVAEAGHRTLPEVLAHAAQKWDNVRVLGAYPRSQD
jgi:chorismate mutase-like protein